MPQTSTEYGRQKILWPDLGHDGGVNLHSKIVSAVTMISNNISRVYFDLTNVDPNDVITLIHNLDTINIRAFDTDGFPFYFEDYEIIDQGQNEIIIRNNSTATLTKRIYIEPNLLLTKDNFYLGAKSSWVYTGVQALINNSAINILPHQDNVVLVMGIDAPVTVTMPSISPNLAYVTTARLIGNDSTNTVTINPQSNCILNGDITLGLGSVIDLQWIPDLSKWVEVSRNMIGGI